MADSRADRVLRGYDRLKSDRGTWETHWQEAAERVWPTMADMIGTRTPGEKRSEKIFDSTAQRALPRFAAACDSLLVPQTQKWHGLMTGVDELDEDVEVKRWLDATRDILFRKRYSTKANFASQMFECWLGLGCFGTYAMFVDETPGVTWRYRAVALSEMVIDTDHQGRVDVVYRCFQMSARAASLVPEWKGTLPESVTGKVASQPDTMFEIVHCVCPNDDYREGMAGPDGMRYRSTYVLRDGMAVLQDDGYRTMPYAVGRYVTGTREKYGRSPAMEALADIKTLNEMEKSNLRVAHRLLDPPYILMEDGALNAFSARPNSMNYGYLREDGTPLIQQLEMRGDPRFAIEQADQKRRAVNDSFLVTLFQILIEDPRVQTATEVLLRAQEKGQLLGPTMGRQQNEGIGPIIDRELDMASHGGLLPEPPPRMLEYLRSGGEVVPEYTGPLARLMQAEEASGILRTVEAMIPLAQATGDARPLRRINADVSLKIIAEANGVPAKALRTDDELAAMDEAEREQMQMEQLLQAAPLAGQAAKSFAEAEVIGASAPRRGVPGI